MAEKTNMEYLKEFIKDNDEALEFWEAVQKELNDAKGVISILKTRIKDANGRISILKASIKEKDEEINILEESLASDSDLEKIDCGIGSIFYREPDNIQLQSLMEDFKEKHQVHL